MKWSAKKNDPLLWKNYWNIEVLVALSLWHNLHLRRRKKDNLFNWNTQQTRLKLERSVILLIDSLSVIS